MYMHTLQKKTAQAIINCFETGKPLGRYDLVEVLPDGAGITYGRSGATDRHGNLDEIVIRYIDLDGKFSDEFRPYLNDLADPSMPLTNNDGFKSLLRRAAREDEKMIEAQDQIFDENYWNPAMQTCVRLGLTEALSGTVVYDSFIHGSFSTIRGMFREVPPARGGDEKAWTAAYVKARRRWLENHPRKILNKTVYRMDCFLGMIRENNWCLALPIRANGILINLDSLRSPVRSGQ